MKGGAGNIVIRNKKASHDYEFLEKFIAGIKLTGTEIKSIRLERLQFPIHTVCSKTENSISEECTFQNTGGET